MALYNNNLRDTLDGTVRIMSSRHLNIVKMLREFYSSADYDPEKYGRPWEYAISMDEVIRLLMLQSYSYYDSSKKGAIYNIFNCKIDPTPVGAEDEDRVPCLIKIRVFDTIRYAGEKGVTKANIIKQGEALGFLPKETRSILSEFVQERLAESVEGTVISRIERLYCTPKGEFFAWLSKTIVYLENIIGDTYINYPGKVRRPYEGLKVDLKKVLQFIDFIRQRECAELRVARKRGDSCYNTCMSLVNMLPLCFRLLVVVCRRARDVKFWETNPNGTAMQAAITLHKRILKDTERGLLGGHYVKESWEHLFKESLYGK